MNDPNGGPGNRRSERRSAGGMSGGGFSAARGAALIAVAVILGIVLLNAIDDGNDGPVGDGGAKSTTSSTSTTTTTVAGGTGSTSPTTAKAVAVPPSEVTVAVLNGSGRGGVAGTLTNTLKAKGYKTLAANNAPVRTGSVIDAKVGKAAVCSALLPLVPGAKVQAMPTPPPTTGDADCIIVIGS